MTRTLTLLSFLAVEVILLYYGTELTDEKYRYYTYFFLILFLGGVGIIRLESLKKFPSLFRKLIASELYSFSGAVLIFFTIINLGWFQDTLREDLLVFPLVFVPALTAIILSLKGEALVNKNQEIKVIFSGLSPKPYHEKLSEQEMMATGKWGAWDPIRELLDTYIHLDHLVIMGCAKVATKLAQFVSSRPSNPSVNILFENVDVNDFEDVFKKTRTVINTLKKKHKYSDDELLFNVTSSTKMITLALGFHAVKSSRHAVYHSQNTNKSVKDNQKEFELSLNKIRPVIKTWLEEDDYGI